MTQQRTLRVAINGYGVIGKRVADAVASQDDMVLAGVADTAHDWRTRVALSKGFRLYGATKAHADAMHQAGIAISGTLDDLLDEADIVVDCTPKSVASQNIETYRQRGVMQHDVNRSHSDSSKTPGLTSSCQRHTVTQGDGSVGKPSGWNYEYGSARAGHSQPPGS